MLSSDDRGMGRLEVENIRKDETRSGKMDNEMRVEKRNIHEAVRHGRDIFDMTSVLAKRSRMGQGDGFVPKGIATVTLPRGLKF